MKNIKLAIALAALSTGVSFAFAQFEDEYITIAPSEVLAASPIAQFIAGHEAETAAHADHLREVERAMAVSQIAMKLAQANPQSGHSPEKDEAIHRRYVSQTERAGEASRVAPKALTTTAYRKGSVGRTLVIPKDTTDAKSLAEVEEDMNVMAHILDKAASDDRRSGRAMGIPVFGRFSYGHGSPQNLFLEGSGALFFLNVNYPLQPAPDKDATADAKEKTTSEWDEAKKEMARPAGGSADVFAFGESFERSFAWDSGSLSPYDADKVEDLKTDLITALKNATHIRKLKADETVTVVVTGANAIGGRTIKNRASKPSPREEELVVAELNELNAGDRGPAVAPAKLVLRVRKADADAFQNGKLELTDFKKKVTVMVY